MQVLTVEKDGQQISSKPFDFEAMCLINDIHSHNADQGTLRMGARAVSHLFEGTGVTDEDIEKLSVQKRTAMSLQVWNWYCMELESQKNE